MAVVSGARIVITESGVRAKVPTKYTARQRTEDTTGKMTLEEFFLDVKSRLISVSEEVLKESIDAGVFPANHLRYVDNKDSKKIEQVYPFGTVEYVAGVSILEPLRFIFDGLMMRAKVRSGAYKKSFQVRVNKQVVATDDMSFTMWLQSLTTGAATLKPTDVISFVNTSPYARKLERLGITSTSPDKPKTRKVKSKDKLKRRGDTILAPSGVFYLTQKQALRKYKKNVKIRFSFVSGASLGGISTRNFQARSALERLNPRSYLYPVLSLRLDDRGGVL